MRIVALEAVADGGAVNFSLNVGSFLVGVTGDAERNRGGGGQLHARDVLVDADFMATQAAGRDRGVHRLSFRLLDMALGTFRCVRFRIQGDRVLTGPQPRDHQSDQHAQHQGLFHSWLTRPKNSHPPRERRKPRSPR